MRAAKSKKHRCDIVFAEKTVIIAACLTSSVWTVNSTSLSVRPDRKSRNRLRDTLAKVGTNEERFVSSYWRKHDDKRSWKHWFSRSKGFETFVKKRTSHPLWLGRIKEKSELVKGTIDVFEAWYLYNWTIERVPKKKKKKAAEYQWKRLTVICIFVREVIKMFLTGMITVYLFQKRKRVCENRSSFIFAESTLLKAVRWEKRLHKQPN